MARLAKAPNAPSRFNSPMRGRAPPSSPPSTFLASPISETSQTPPFHPRARPLSKLSLNIFRLLRNHPNFHQEDENWRTRLGLYKLVQQIVENVVGAVEEEPLMFSKKERRKKEDGQEVAIELGLGELRFADRVSFQSPVAGAGREYFASGKSPTKAKLPKPAKKKSKPAALEETNLNSLAISKAENLTGGLDTGFLDSEIGSEKPLSKGISIEKNVSKVSTTIRVKRQAITKTVQAVLPKSSAESETALPGPEQEEVLQQHTAPERVTRSRRCITPNAATAPIEKQAPVGKNTRGTRPYTTATLPEEASVTSKKAMGIKRMTPLKRPIQGLTEVTSPISQKITAPPQVKPGKIILGDLLNEPVVDTESIPQIRTLRSSKRLAGPKGKGSLRSINQELQISSEAMTGAIGEEMGFIFQKLSGEARMDSISANGKAAGENVKQMVSGKPAEVDVTGARGLSVVIEKMPVSNGDSLNSKGRGSNSDRPRLVVTGPTHLKPTIVRRSSRSTNSKGSRMQESVPSKGK